MSQKELKYQREIVKAVEAGGGFAKKLSHRTLVGIPDLLVKLPKLRAALVEVKQVAVPKKADTVVLDLTTPQRRILTEAHEAGMHACVLAFLEYDGANIGIGIWSIVAFPKNNRVSKDIFVTSPNRNRGKAATLELAAFLKYEESLP